MTSSDARVAAVLLAGGPSARMGSNKMLLVVEGEALVRRAARRAIEAGLSPLVVVLGRDAERVGAELDGIACLRAVNPDPSRGIETSLRAGLAALPAEASAAVILLADMPLVTSDMVAAVADRHRRGGARIVVCDYEGVVAPPMLFERGLFPELAREGSGRRVASRHPAETEVVRWPAAALVDVDRPEDAARLRASLRRGA